MINVPDSLGVSQSKMYVERAIRLLLVVADATKRESP